MITLVEATLVTGSVIGAVGSVVVGSAMLVEVMGKAVA